MNTATKPHLTYISLAECHVAELNSRADLGNKEEWETFVNSIRQHGILQPLLVRESPDGPSAFQIVAGKRRYTAALEAGLTEAPALIHYGLQDDQDASVAMLIENLQRRAFNAMEEAVGYRYLLHCGLTQAQIATAVRIPSATLSRRLLLLSLSADDQRAVRQKRLALGAAERRATCAKWIDQSLEKIATDTAWQVKAAHHHDRSQQYFDELTGHLRHDMPYLAMDDTPTDGELARNLPLEKRKLTWWDLIAGSDAGESIHLLRVISPDWRCVTLAEASAVKAYIRANSPGHLRKEDTNLAHAEKEAKDYAHVIWQLAASATLQALEEAGISKFDHQVLRISAINCCARVDLDMLARRCRVQDVHKIDNATLRTKLLGELQHIDTGTLLLETMLLIAARRDGVRICDHPATQPLLDALGVDPTYISDTAIATVTDALRAKA